jgi:NAD-dependent SIR2 family protein deacetylase
MKETTKNINDDKVAIMGNNGDAIFINSTKRKIYYISSVERESKDWCINCGNKVKTTAHHLIPKRAQCQHPILRELRIRVCDDCEKYIHPELKLFETFFKEWEAGNYERARASVRRN